MKLKTSKRSAFRYFRIIENSGFIIANKKGKYTLISAKVSPVEIKTLLHITEEEAENIYNRLSNNIILITAKPIDIYDLWHYHLK